MHWIRSSVLYRLQVNVMDSYLRMMKRMTQLYDLHKAQMCDVPADTDSFAAFIEELDEEKLQGCLPKRNLSI